MHTSGDMFSFTLGDIDFRNYIPILKETYAVTIFLTLIIVLDFDSREYGIG